MSKRISTHTGLNISKDSRTENVSISERAECETIAASADSSRCDTPVKLTKKQNALHFIKFGLFSASAGIIQFLSFALLNEIAKLPYWPAYLIALTLSVLYNFTVNRKFTFKSANNVPVAMLKVLAYYALFTPLSTLWGDALTVRAGWNEYIVLSGTMVINLISEFLFCRFVVYRNSINTSEAGKKENIKYAVQGKENESDNKDRQID